mmetsp:Transcript_11802/g.17525  ORF Transcript_11802/g.17525 Transcript_11802/m.17525 type:complete len:894 (+) Transcript_11802:86-2767(+)
MILRGILLLLLITLMVSLTQANRAVFFVLEDISNRVKSHRYNYGRLKMDDLIYQKTPDINSTSAVFKVSSNDEVKALIEREISLYNTSLFFGTNPMFSSTLQVLSKTHTNRNFVNILGETFSLPNFGTILLKYYQVTYLAGYLAAKMSQTNKICKVSRKEGNLGENARNINGFLLGAQRANPAIQGYLIEIEENASSEDERVVSNLLISNGCDVIMGASKDGSLYQEQENIYYIAEEFDWAPLNNDRVLTSTLSQWQHVFYTMYNLTFSGQSLSDTFYFYGIEDEEPSLSLSNFSPLIPFPVQNEIYLIYNQILNREFQIFCGPIIDVNDLERIPNNFCPTEPQLLVMQWRVKNSMVNFGSFKSGSTQCSAGEFYTYQLSDNTVICTPCPAGSYSSTPIEGSCTPCPIGTYSDNERATKCTACPSTAVAKEIGSTFCTPREISILSLIVIASTLVILSIICIVLLIFSCFIISRSLLVIRKQRERMKTVELVATCISTMDLDNPAIQSLNNKYASSLEKKLGKIIANLNEFRPYLPDSLFAQDESVYTDRELRGEVAVKRAGNLKAITKEKKNKSMENQLNVLRSRMDINLILTYATFFVIDFCRFNEISQFRTSPQDLCTVHSDTLNLLIEHVRRTNGVIHTLRGDKFLCSWNAASRNLAHEKNGLTTALNFMRDFNQMRMVWSNQNLPIFNVACAVLSGQVHYGSIGSLKLRSNSILGENMELLFMLVKLNRYYGTDLLTNKAAYESMKYYFHFRKVDRLSIKIQPTDSVASFPNFEIYEVISMNDNNQDSDDNESSTYYSSDEEEDDSDIAHADVETLYHSATVLFFNHDIHRATDCFQRCIKHPMVTPSIARHCQRFLVRIREQQYDNLRMIVHPKPEVGKSLLSRKFL